MTYVRAVMVSLVSEAALFLLFMLPVFLPVRVGRVVALGALRGQALGTLVSPLFWLGSAAILAVVYWWIVRPAHVAS